MKKIMKIEDYVKENREVINDLRIASALLEKRRPIIAESLMDLAERLDDLAESEDERIRKWIANYIHRGVFDEEEHPKALKAIEYLEKQKEQQNNSDAPKGKSIGGNFSSSHKDKNLDEIAQDYVDGVKEYNPDPTWDLMQTAVCYGANWQKEQFKKNRLANCDAVSKEEIDRETDFAMEIIEKEHRQPTFNDAINYGMRLQKEQKPVRAAKEVWKEMRHEVYAQASGNRHEPNYSDDSTKMFSLCDIDEIFEKISNSTVVSQPAPILRMELQELINRINQ